MSHYSEEHYSEHSPLLIENMESNFNTEIIFNMERQTSEPSLGNM
jgi:predicted thioredoxin/glutaredoxin